MKFCPQDGTARNGNFCSTCGFRFPELELNTGSANVSAGWYPDTTAAGQERYWDGVQWTAQVRPSGTAIAEAAAAEALAARLVYGEGFDPAKHCTNCGVALVNNACPICAD